MREGGRTGFAALVCAILFFLSSFLSPLFGQIPAVSCMAFVPPQKAGPANWRSHCHKSFAGRCIARCAGSQGDDVLPQAVDHRLKWPHLSFLALLPTPTAQIATSPILVLVGILIFASSVVDINWDDYTEVIPVLVTAT
jgi:hypothetical protein